MLLNILIYSNKILFTNEFLENEIILWTNTIIAEGDIVFFSFILFLPLSLHELLLKYNAYRQHLYDKVMLYIMHFTITNFIIIQVHTALYYFRYFCMKTGNFIEKYISLNLLALAISIIASRLHHAGIMIIFCLLFIRLDFAVLSMLRFYKKHPSIFHKNFPQVLQPNARGMWSQAVKTTAEAMSNPQVQAVGVAVAGALAWKCLDIHDTTKQATISDADRQAEAIQREADRQADAIQQEANRQADAVQQEANRQTEAIQREADRQEENRRAAFDKLTSVEYNDLSEEQKNKINNAIKTGIL